MNKQKMLDQMDSVRSAIEDCLDDQTEILAINHVGIIQHPPSVHLANVLDLGRCFEGINIDIDEDFCRGFSRKSVTAHGIAVSYTHLTLPTNREV